MRIAILSRNFLVTGGGAERYSIHIAECIAEKHDVHVFAQTIEHHHPKITYHRISARLYRPRWINQLLFNAISWWMTKNGFDVVIAHENTWHGNVHVVHVLPVKYSLFSFKHRLKYLKNFIKVATSPRLISYLLLEYFRFTPNRRKKFVTTSNALQQAMIAAYPKTKDKMLVIKPGVEVDLVTENFNRFSTKNKSRIILGLPVNGICLLFVGNDFRKKGLPALMEALAKLPHQFFLAIAGNPVQKQSMLTIAESLGITQRCYFLGSVKNLDIAYCAADCLVHPTLQDSYAMVVLEAFAHHLPVVVSSASYCGISEDLSSHHEALIIEDPKNPQQICELVAEIFNDETLRLRLIRNGKDFAARHSWASAGEAYETVMKSLVISSKE